MPGQGSKQSTCDRTALDKRGVDARRGRPSRHHHRPGQPLRHVIGVHSATSRRDLDRIGARIEARGEVGAVPRRCGGDRPEGGDRGRQRDADSSDARSTRLGDLARHRTEAREGDRAGLCDLRGLHHHGRHRSRQGAGRRPRTRRVGHHPPAPSGEAREGIGAICPRDAGRPDDPVSARRRHADPSDPGGRRSRGDGASDAATGHERHGDGRTLAGRHPSGGDDRGRRVGRATLASRQDHDGVGSRREPRDAPRAINGCRRVPLSGHALSAIDLDTCAWHAGTTASRHPPREADRSGQP